MDLGVKFIQLEWSTLPKELRAKDLIKIVAPENIKLLHKYM